MKNVLYNFLIITFAAANAFGGGGPAQVAKIDRKLWPYTINTPGEFDYASKMEMLVFAGLLNEISNETNEDSLKKYLGTEKISLPSLLLWEGQTKKLFISKFEKLPIAIPHDLIPVAKPITWTSIAKAAAEQGNNLPENIRPWYAEAQRFYKRYLYEQMRLAAMFPRVTSEILTLDNSEITGFEMQDKQFLLTFDDGPTVPNGHTDKLIATLDKNQKTGIFFILGENYNIRLKAGSISNLHNLYGTNVVASHGKIHQPHQKYEGWQHSLSYTHRLIDSVIPENQKTKYFRPPYGQRNMNIVKYLGGKNTKIMLWNIDSQDWSNKISAPEVADRVITLMLLWRSGILLFHDIHPKCKEALPVIWKYFDGSGIGWKDPNQL